MVLTTSDLEDTLTMTNPSKRQREESSALDEVDKKALLEMIQLNKKMDEKSADQITQADTNAMQHKTFAFLCSIVPKILETLATSNELKKQVGSLQKEVNSLKNEVLNQQIRLSAKSVVIRDLPQIKAGRESQLELKNQFENVLKELEISQMVTISDIFRLKSNKERAGRSDFLPTKVEFMTKFQKGLFMSKLKYLKSYNNIKVSFDIPKLLLGQSNELEKKGFELRKAEPTTKTRVMLKGQKLSLYAKRENEQHFQEVEFN